eukprot:11194032-Lingulodinium_polyedra.AAC.1
MQRAQRLAKPRPRCRWTGRGPTRCGSCARRRPPRALAGLARGLTAPLQPPTSRPAAAGAGAAR